MRGSVKAGVLVRSALELRSIAIGGRVTPFELDFEEGDLVKWP